jgi:tRNA-specific 2-thiouridylase
LVEEADLPVGAGDSQDLCFVAGGRYHDLLRREGCVPGHGEVLDTEGNVVGTHKGHTAYTPGQRFGVRGKRYYVIEKRSEANTIVIAGKDRALKSNIKATGVNLFLPLPADSSGRLRVRYRYNTPPVGARIVTAGDGRITVMTDEPCFAPAPGQVLAGYDGDNLVFGAIIESAA